MKKATAPTVAQEIKSTTQLSPPNWVDDLDRLQKQQAYLALLPCGANKYPLINGWPTHNGYSVEALKQVPGLRAVGARTGIHTGPLVCFDFDGLSSIRWAADHGLNPSDLKTWQVHRTDNSNRLKVLFQPTAEQITLLPNGEIQGKTKTGPEEALEVFFAGGRQVVVIGDHPSGGSYFWPEGLGPEVLSAPPDHWWAHAIDVATRTRNRMANGSRSSVSRTGTQKLNPCPICGRHSRNGNQLWCSETETGAVLCMPGVTFNAEAKHGPLKVGQVVDGWALTKRTPIDEGDVLTFVPHKSRPLISHKTHKAGGRDVINSVQEFAAVLAADFHSKGSVGDVQKVPIQTAVDVLDKRRPRDWIVDQFVARGALTLVAGATGSSKSTLFYGLAQAVSTGAKFMGQLKTKRGKVCVIQSDESFDNAADKLKIMGIEADFHLLTDWDCLEMQRLERLQEQEKYDLIVMDSITTLMGAGRPNGPGMNDAEFGFDLYGINDWAADKQVAILMSAHLRKRGKDAVTKRVTGDDVYGAGSQTWASSEVWGLWRADNPKEGYNFHLQMECLKGRFCTEGVSWNIDGSEEDFSHLLIDSANEADLAPEKQTQCADDAFGLIEGSDCYWTVENIRQHLGVNKRHAYRVLQRLFTENKIGRQKLASQHGRPSYGYCDLTFCTSPIHPINDP